MTFIYHHRTAARGGEGNHIQSVVAALQRAGHVVTVVSPPGVDLHHALTAPPLDKGETKEVGFNRLWKWVSCRSPQVLFEASELLYNLVAIVRVGRELSRDRSAVIYERCASFLFTGALLARVFNRPLILEVNEVAGLARARGLVFARLARAIERFTFAGATEIVTVSSYLEREILKRGGRPGHVHVMPNAIDPARFRPSPSEVQGARQALAVEGALVVGFVGWFDRWDRLELLVEMCRMLRGAIPQLRLVLVGDGPVADEVRALAAKYGLQDVVRITGAQPRHVVPSLIAAMDICVLPDSNAFGSPMVLFEFMALGRAIVAADVGGIRDVMHDGVNGLLVRGGDLAGLTEAVRSLATDRARRHALGAAARADVLAHHTWDATAARIADFAAGRTPLAATRRAEVA